VASLRTEITEIVTGLATLGVGDVDWALGARPRAMVNVSDAHWEKLGAARRDPAHEHDFASAWANGLAFLGADDGLRGRIPRRVEWKGHDRLPAVSDVPADLRIDHVYLVSCKYLSKILHNPSPTALFDRCLGQREVATVPDWYAEVAPRHYSELYAVVRAALPESDLPPQREHLDRNHRQVLAKAFDRTLPPEVDGVYRDFAFTVADCSARRWSAALGDRSGRERMLWRLLRLSAAPYFILGSSRGSSLRLRIDTPWDWRQRYRLRGFEVWGEPAGQPLVRWQTNVADREAATDRSVRGHVEVRWSHGRFRGAPEAKVYLDTPHEAVPGYQPLV